MLVSVTKAVVSKKLSYSKNVNWREEIFCYWKKRCFSEVHNFLFSYRFREKFNRKWRPMSFNWVIDTGRYRKRTRQAEPCSFLAWLGLLIIGLVVPWSLWKSLKSAVENYWHRNSLLKDWTPLFASASKWWYWMFLLHSYPICIPPTKMVNTELSKHTEFQPRKIFAWNFFF